MAENSKSASQSPVLSSSGKPHSAGGRQRIISSCLTCRRRKVKCDHVHPVCGACKRGNHVCTYATDQGLGQPSSGRVSKPALSSSAKGGRNTDVQARLDRLELLLEQAVSGKVVPSTEIHHRRPEPRPKQEMDSPFSPASTSHSSPGAGISSDNRNGTLLLDEGQSQFVSSLHYALLADEVSLRVRCSTLLSSDHHLLLDASSPGGLLREGHQPLLYGLFQARCSPILHIVH